MAYISQHTGTEIDNSVSINSTQNNRLSTIETKLNTVETGANKLVDNCIKTSYIQNKAVTTDKLADDVKDSLSSIKTYYGTLRANAWIDDLSTSSDYGQYALKWKWERFASKTCDSNIRNTLLTAAPTAIAYYADTSISISMNIADSYTARCTTYIYCDTAVNFNCSVVTDDAGAVYINGNLVNTIVSCAETAMVIPFIKGVNCLEVFYTEGSGGDGWKFTPALNTRIGYEFKAMCAEPAHVYHQTITPVCLEGDSQINQYTIFSPAVISNGTIELSELKDRINCGYIKANNDKSITIYYSHLIPVDKDITLYWFGRNIQ